MNRVLSSLFLALVLVFGGGIARAAPSAEVQAAYQQGTQQLMWGEYAKARDTLVKATKAEPGWAPPYTALAMAMLELGDGAGAEYQLNEGRKNGVKPAQVAHLQAFALVLQDRLAEAYQVLASNQIEAKYRGYAARVRAVIHDRKDEADLAGGAFDEAVNADSTIRGLWGDVAAFRFRRGDVAGAIDAAIIEARNAPRSRRAMMIMGDLIRGRYGLVAALPWFRRAVQLEPGNLDALGELAATLGDAGHSIEMLAVTRRMIAADPNNARAFYLQAVLAARAGKYDLARNLMYHTKDKMADVPSVMLLNAVLELRAGASEAAIARLKQLLDTQPDNFKVRRLLGLAMWRSGDLQGSIDILLPLAERPDADAYTLALIGRAFEAGGDMASAAEFLDRSRHQSFGAPAPFDVNGDMMRLARASGGPSDNAAQGVPYINKQMQDGNVAAGLAHAQRMAKLNPGTPAAQILEGDSYVAAGQLEQAVNSYRRAADLRFNAPVALRMVDTLNALGSKAEALTVLDYFLSQNPRSVPGLQLAADHFIETGQWPRAIHVLTSLRDRLGGRDAAISADLGWAWFNKGDATKGLRFTSEAYALQPGNADIASKHGWVLFKSGKDKVGGLALLKKASAMAPEDTEARERLALALKQPAATPAKGPPKAPVPPRPVSDVKAG